MVVALPREAFAVSFTADGVSGFGSKLSGLPSPSVSAFKGFVPLVTSSIFDIPSLSQSPLLQVVLTLAITWLDGL